MVITGRDIGRQRAERIERRLAAFTQLLVHVHFDLVHRHMARPFDHHLTAFGMRNLGQLTEGFQLRKLRGVIRVGNRARAEAIAEREADIIHPHDVANLFKMFVQERFLVVRQHPLRHDRPTARHNPAHAVSGEVDVSKAHAGMDGEIVNALLGLLNQRIAEYLPGKVLCNAVHFLQRLINRHRTDRHG